MEALMTKLSNEIVFFAAWIIIPLIMEIIPAICGFFLLLGKRMRNKKDCELSYFPQISLIIPVYNSENTLYECLTSVVKSDYPIDKIDCLLVNNKSADHSFETYIKFREDYPELSLNWINSEQGKSKALNMALFNAEGKYIIHIDSDGELEEHALTRLVTRFESNENLHCMTGAVLTNPRLIEEEKFSWKCLLNRLEFYEYAQAFLAGRNFQAELNAIFTMSGAFSAFRKSTILKTQLYNTETVCEDTHVTFQIRRLLHQKIQICETAVFMVDPIDSVKKLYVQRQRWQRGEMEVAHMFRIRGSIVGNFFSNLLARVLMYDHTFAFPRMIWYFALLFLALVDYPFSFIVKSLIVIYVQYTVSAFLYYLNVMMYLRDNQQIRAYYGKHVLLVCLLPFYNFMIYWFRLAGIVNSIKRGGQWRTQTFREEWEIVVRIISKDFLGVKNRITKVREGLYEKDKGEQ